MSEQVLVIRKPDRTIHVAPLFNEPILRAYNNTLYSGQKWKIEVMDKEQAEMLGPYDKEFVSPNEAVDRLHQKDNEIAQLREMLSKQNAGEPAPEISAKDKEIAELRGLLQNMQVKQNITEQLPDVSNKTKK